MKRFLLVAGLFSTLIVIAEQTKVEKPSLALSNKQTVRRVFEEVLNPGKLERLPQFLTDEYVGPGGLGVSAFAQPVKELREAFPDIHWTLEDVIAEGDRVAVRWTWEGTHRKAFRGFPPTGKRMTNRAIAVFKLADGKIVQAWMQTDRLGFLQQVGAVAETLGTPRTVHTGGVNFGPEVGSAENAEYAECSSGNTSFPVRLELEPSGKEQHPQMD